MRRRGLWKPPGAAKGFRPPRVSGATSAGAAPDAGTARGPVPAVASQTPAPAATRPPPPVNPLHRRVFRSPAVAARPQGPKPGQPAAASPAAGVAGGSDCTDRPKPCYLEVLYCKHSNKKRKTYMDGVLQLSGKRATLMDMEGKRVTGSFCTVKTMSEGETLGVGAFDLEVTKVLSAAAYESGSIFTAGSSAQGKENTGTLSLGAAPRLGGREGGTKRPAAHGLAGPGKRARTPSSSSAKALTPRYDPMAPGAVVLDGHPASGGEAKTCPIVVDPTLGAKLREHQTVGVRFLWRCITEQATAEGSDGGAALPEGLRCAGCILADEMGLGKTLTTITLLWTALRQGPAGVPLTRRAVVVTPSSLVDNWAREFKKWLGNERLRPLVMNVRGQEATSLINDFEHGSHSVYPVLIVSYEMYRKFAPAIHRARPGIMVCDEAHRLKSSTGNKTISALAECPTRRRILLTGTPVQNDLEEFYAMLSFANPSILGTRQSFRNVFGAPIERGRDKGASPADCELAHARSQQLQALTSAFILRRTSDLLRKHLPPKTETVVFCRMSAQQQALYESLLHSGTFRSVVSAGGRGNRTVAEEPLQLIGVLRLLCTHPFLAMAGKAAEAGGAADAAGVAEGEEDEQPLRAVSQGAAGAVADFLRDAGYPEAAQAGRAAASAVSVDTLCKLSGKCHFLMELLRTIQRAGDRVVVVSAFTCTLDLIARMCEHLGIGCMRLDGSTEAGKRQSLVNRFNMPHCPESAFLLSAKAGGVGLNLIGANRLIMVDLDWNPAVDQQAMARVWRDGQRKHVYVYRLFMTGTIEEKMFQRQVLKLDMAGSVVSKRNDNKRSNKSAGPGRLSRDELKKLFMLRTDTDCDTYDVLAGDGGDAGDGASWEAYRGPDSLEDLPLKEAVLEAGVVSFVHVDEGQGDSESPQPSDDSAIAADDDSV